MKKITTDSVTFSQCWSFPSVLEFRRQSEDRSDPDGPVPANAVDPDLPPPDTDASDAPGSRIEHHDQPQT